MITLNQITRKFKSDPGYNEELIDNSDEDDYLKLASRNRKCTNLPFLIVQAVLLLLLFGLLGYCIVHGNIDRITKGYDNCGNICGKKNTFGIQEQKLCAARDMTDQPYLRTDDDHRVCVQSCGNGQTVLNGYLCVDGEWKADKKNFITGFSKDLYICSEKIMALLGIAVVFSVIGILFLRYTTTVFIWIVQIGTIIMCIGASTYFGIFASKLPSGGEYKKDLDASVRASIVFGFAAFGGIVSVIVLRDRIPFVAQLFREAGKSIQAIPLLLVEPILTIVTLIISWGLWFYFLLWNESAGIPTELYSGKVHFEKDAVMYFTYWFNLFMTLWMTQFFCGCQDMLISGAVSTWYFASNKSKLDKPILRSAGNMIKYHLGTISLGSLIVAIIQFIKLLLLLLRRPSRLLTCLRYYIEVVEQWVRYFTRNIYIVTAIHGYSFRQAGSLAVHLIINNLIKVLTILTIGDTVLVMAKLIVGVGAASLGYLSIKDELELEYLWTMLFLMIGMCYVIAHCFFSVYSTAIDTIFICFCEDCETNDGINCPYYMSRELMEFIERSRNFHDEKNRVKANSNSTPAS